MSKDVHAWSYLGPKSHPHGHLHLLLRQRLPFRIAENAGTLEVPRLLQRVSQAPCEQHVPHSPAFGGRDVALPLGTCDRELPLAEVDVRPLQRHHLPASPPSITISCVTQPSALAISKSRSYSANS